MGFKIGIEIVLICQVLGAPVLADALYPDLCCPQTCRAVEPVVPFHSGSSMTGAANIAGMVITENTMIDLSPDDRTHVCVGFDEFGDPELKCLFRPSVDMM